MVGYKKRNSQNVKKQQLGYNDLEGTRGSSRYAKMLYNTGGKQWKSD